MSETSLHPAISGPWQECHHESSGSHFMLFLWSSTVRWTDQELGGLTVVASHRFTKPCNMQFSVKELLQDRHPVVRIPRKKTYAPWR